MITPGFVAKSITLSGYNPTSEEEHNKSHTCVLLVPVAFASLTSGSWASRRLAAAASNPESETPSKFMTG